jgi:MFS family permease
LRSDVIGNDLPKYRLGLRANIAQFSLLVLVNAFVGGMVGVERTVVPLIGSREFGLTSVLTIASFIVSFGVTKALANLISGPLAERFGRKPVLVAGWLLGLPVPLLVMLAPDWRWVVGANALLGVNQGLAWSMTVVMKIDLVGPARRGLAMGLNEASGYFAVGATALATGYLAAAHGLRPDPFYLGLAYAALGLTLSLFLIRETRDLAYHEGRRLSLHSTSGEPVSGDLSGFWRVFATTSWSDRNLFAASQAGMINNLNDGVAWGIFPLFFAAHGLSVSGIGWIKGIYPVVWALGQLVTGPLSDRFGRKGLIVWGMCVQAIGFGVIGAGGGSFSSGVIGSTLLGVGTAMVYPSLLATVADAAHPQWRAQALGVYRFWRDSGYVWGGLAAGILADSVGLVWAIWAAGALTLASGIVAQVSTAGRPHLDAAGAVPHA